MPRRVGPEEARRLCPLLREGYAAAAMVDDGARDVDVAALHGGFLRARRDPGPDRR